MTLAADLLDQETLQQVEDAPSISRDPRIVPEKSELP
jgi:hypothetical protein